MAFLDPMQEYDYGRMKRQANSGYLKSISQNVFDRGQTTANYTQNRTDAVKKFGQMRQQLPYGANRRGVLRSGIFGRQLIDQAQNRTQELGRLEQGYAGQLGQFDLNRQQLEATRGEGLGDAEEYRNRLLQQMAMRVQ